MSVKQERVSIHGGRNSEEGGLITSGHVTKGGRCLPLLVSNVLALKKEEELYTHFLSYSKQAINEMDLGIINSSFLEATFNSSMNQIRVITKLHRYRVSFGKPNHQLQVIMGCKSKT